MLTDLGLFILRFSVGVMLFLGHGLDKLTQFSQRAPTFPDPFHVGHSVSLALAVFAEVFCTAGVIIGFATRLVAIPPFITLMVAALLIHSADPWSKKEFALLYAIPFLVLILTGPGAFSVDWMVRKKK